VDAVPSPASTSQGGKPGRREPALREYLAAVAVISLAGGLALALLGCQTSIVLSNVSGSI